MESRTAKDEPRLTLYEAAQFFGVPESTVRYWLQKGIGPRCERISGYFLRFRLSDLIEHKRNLQLQRRQRAEGAAS